MKILELCGPTSQAGKRYQRRIAIAMSIYIALLFSCVATVKHTHPGAIALYVLALLPALPIVAVLIIMGRYLHEETDEYVRWITVRSMLAGTAILLAAFVVNDFLRTMAHAQALAPFSGFIIFMVSFGVAQGVQKAMDRGRDDD